MFFPQDIEYLISPRALAANFFCLKFLSYKLSIVGRLAGQEDAGRDDKYLITSPPSSVLMISIMIVTSR